MQAMTPPSPASSLPPPPLLPKDTPTRVMKPLPVSADKSVKLRLQSNVVSSRYKSENRWNMNTDYSIPVRCRNGGTSKYADKNPSRAKRKRSASAQQKRDGLRSSRSAMQCSRTGPAAETFNGWVAIQIPDHPTWKRRYFMLDLAHSQLALFRSQRDSSCSIDLINLDGRIESFNEWYEGFEELEAIPHSFAVKFVDGHAWLMYADTEQDKDRLLVLLSEATGVIL